MDYSVVEFTEEKSVAPVPSNWLCDNNSQCFWPKSGPNSSKLVQRKAAPDRNWTKHPVRVLKQCSKLETKFVMTLNLLQIHGITFDFRGFPQRKKIRRRSRGYIGFV